MAHGDGAPVTRTLVGETLDDLHGFWLEYELSGESRLISETEFSAVDHFEVAVALSFFAPIAVTDQGDRAGIIAPHYPIYREHLKADSGSALSLDLGNLWYLHYLACINDNNMWGWVFHALISGPGAEAQNFFTFASLCDTYSAYLKVRGEKDPDVYAQARPYIKTILRSYAPGGVFEPLKMLRWDDLETLSGIAERKTPLQLPVRLLVFALVNVYAKWMGGGSVRYDDGRLSSNMLYFEEGFPGAVFWLPKKVLLSYLRDIGALTSACSVDRDYPGPLLDFWPAVTNDPYVDYYKTDLGGCISRHVEHQGGGRFSLAWMGDSLAENMYLLYIVPPNVRATDACVLRPAFVSPHEG